MRGSEKQQAYATRCFTRLYEGYQYAEGALKAAESLGDEPAAEYWRRAADFGRRMVDQFAEEERSWVIIDALRMLSPDPKKAANQLKFKAMQYHIEKQRAGDEAHD